MKKAAKESSGKSSKRSASKQKGKNKDGTLQRAESNIASISSTISMRTSRASFMTTFNKRIYNAVALRKKLRLMQTFNEEELDVTPAWVQVRSNMDHFHELKENVNEFITDLKDRTVAYEMRQSTLSRSSVRLRGARMSMENVLTEIGSGRMVSLLKQRQVDTIEDLSEESLVEYVSMTEETVHNLPFIKVKLRWSDTFLLFERSSHSVERGTSEGSRVEAANRRYDYLTIGKGKIRRRSEAEAQTTEILLKARGVNTIAKQMIDVGTYISNYEMFDTYQELAQSQHRHPRDIEDRPPSTIEQQLESIGASQEFQLASMFFCRFLAANEFEEGQRRFRNMNLPSPLATEVQYLYQPNILFRFQALAHDKERKAVADLSFCYANADILAVAYGIYSFSAMNVPRAGYVCVWNIKNPGDPERSYFYNVPVASVEFSPFIPTLLAIGLYDGTVEVRDITESNKPPISVSQRGSLSSCDPITSIKWIRLKDSVDPSEVDPFLCLSQDGTVIKFRIINSPYLQSFKQMVIHRVEGTPEGLQVKNTNPVLHQANRQPQGLQLIMHPVYADVYYVLTDEGCLHKCSTNYQHQYLEILKAHDGAVNTMDFSPWSPKLFITAGNDWCVRVWIEGIFKPLLVLSTPFLPVHCAFWSNTHSTVIFIVTRQSFEVWDLRRSVLNPVSNYMLDTSFYTLAKQTKSGHSVALGNQRGNVLMCGLDDMPFQPHFQYDEMEKAIFAAIATNSDLTMELKSVGFFGYPNKQKPEPKY